MLQVRGATRLGGLQIQGATSLRSTDFASAARTNQCGGLQDSGGYKFRGATRRTTDFGSGRARTSSRRVIKDPSM